eukprot:1436822-Prymnesium_polylepis.1
MHDRVAMREGAALDVLAREPHVHALQQQGCPSQLLGQRPIDALARFDHFGTLLIKTGDHPVRLQRIREGADTRTNRTQDGQGNARRRQRPCHIRVRGLVTSLRKRLLKFIHHSTLQFLHRLLVEEPVRYQLLCIPIEHCFVRLDGVVHRWLRLPDAVYEVQRMHLMAMSAIANNVHHHVATKLLTEFGRQLA